MISEAALASLKAKNLYIYNAYSSRSIFTHKKINLFFQEGISQSAHFWHNKLSPDNFFITTLPWYHDLSLVLRNAEFISEISGGDFRLLDNFIVLCNSQAEVENFHDVGFENAIWCNHNAFLDLQVNYITPVDKKYDLVINCRPENWKRPEFAAGINNLAVIKGSNHSKADFFNLNSLNPTYINDSFLSANEVINIVNQSHVGGIFSKIEGACYSSSEFILCGIPVVSTPSLGGRDIWYNDENSVIVNEPSEVAAAVQTLKTMYESDPGLGFMIRQNHIDQSLEHLNRLYEKMNSILEKVGINRDFRDIYKETYNNKMTKYTALGLDEKILL